CVVVARGTLDPLALVRIQARQPPPSPVAQPAKDAKLYGEFIVTDEEPTLFECETKGSVFPSTEQIPVWRVFTKETDKEAILNGSKVLQLSMTVKYYGSSGEEYWTSSRRTYDPQRSDWINEEGGWA
ncbi:unnamed protein product, partial [marine sediment metagenome]